jgi:hypothetical protein
MKLQATSEKGLFYPAQGIGFLFLRNISDYGLGGS